jgi:hypothetical protein
MKYRFIFLLTSLITADYEKDPESYLIETKEVTNKSSLKIPLARGGGVAISIFEL